MTPTTLPCCQLLMFINSVSNNVKLGVALKQTDITLLITFILKFERPFESLFPLLASSDFI